MFKEQIYNWLQKKYFINLQYMQCNDPPHCWLQLIYTFLSIKNNDVHVYIA